MFTLSKENVMDGRAILSGTEAVVYIILPDNRRKVFANLKSMNASVQYTSTEHGILGARQKFNKPGPGKNTGNMKMYYNTSIFRELAHQYKETGIAPKHNLQVVNNDASTIVGPQVIYLYGVFFTDQTLFMLDIDSDGLEEDVNFTFDDWDYENLFNEQGGLLNA